MSLKQKTTREFNQLPDTIKKIDYSMKDIAEIPADINRFTHLKKLNLYGARVSIPKTLWKIKSIEELSFGNSNHPVMPPEIGNLQNLKKLNWVVNDIRELPSEITNLTQLQELYLGKNKLHDLPNGFDRLQNLRELYLSDNEFTAIPPEIFNLSKLTHLSFINNKITSIPSEIGRLKSLTHLALNDNPNITQLPPELDALPNLKSIMISGTGITRLSDVMCMNPKIEVYNPLPTKQLCPNGHVGHK